MSEKVTKEEARALVEQVREKGPQMADVAEALDGMLDDVDAREAAQGAPLGMYTAEGEEYVIAYSAEDAAKVYEETCGEPLLGIDDKPITWDRLDGEKPFTLTDEDGNKVTKLRREWVAEHGRGYFASANV